MEILDRRLGRHVPRASSSAATAGDLDLDRLLRALPSGVAVGLFELSTGTPLQVGTLDRHTQEDFDLLAATTYELFQEGTVTAIERMDLEHRQGGEERRQALQQIIVQSKNLLYVFLRGKSRPDLVLAALCRADANLGLALLAVRDALRELERRR
jgi:hypothetical protein